MIKSLATKKRISHANRHGDIKCDITNHTGYDCINGYYEWLEQEADNN